MKNDYLIGYLPREYIKYFRSWYIVVFIINLGQIFGSKIGFSLPGLMFTREPIVHMGAYFGMILAWNYAKEEHKWGRFGKTSIIYFKSVGFLYLITVIINLVSALYAGTVLGLKLLAVPGYAFYVVWVIYTLVALRESWEGQKQETPKSFLWWLGLTFFIIATLKNMENDARRNSYHGHYSGRSLHHGEHSSHWSRPHVSRFRFRH